MAFPQSLTHENLGECMSAPEGLGEEVTHRMERRQENSPSRLPGEEGLDTHMHLHVHMRACPGIHKHTFIHLHTYAHGHVYTTLPYANKGDSCGLQPTREQYVGTEIDST